MLGAENILVGLIIGAAMSIPFGPVGMIGIKRILVGGQKAGVACGLGVAIGDTLFAIVAVSGIAWISHWLLSERYLIQLVGGLIIAIAGAWGFFSYKEKTENDDVTFAYRLRNSLGMMVMTLANPQTIIGFSTAFAALVHFYTLETPLDALLLVVGVFAGSLSWWLAISVWLDRVRDRLPPDLLYKLHQSAAVIITILGVGLMVHAFVVGDAEDSITL